MEEGGAQEMEGGSVGAGRGVTWPRTAAHCRADPGANTDLAVGAVVERAATPPLGAFSILQEALGDVARRHEEGVGWVERGARSWLLLDIISFGGRGARPGCGAGPLVPGAGSSGATRCRPRHGTERRRRGEKGGGGRGLGVGGGGGRGEGGTRTSERAKRVQ